MATFHCQIKNSNQRIASGGGKISAAAHADYICREGKYSRGEKSEELIYKEHQNMPEWARGREREFWQAQMNTKEPTAEPTPKSK